MFNDMNIIYGCDYYKVSHKAMLPDGLEYQYNNFVARSNKYLSDYDKVVVFGVKRAWNKIVDKFNKDLFNKTKEEATEIINEYKHFVQDTLGIENYDVSHWVELYELGYLPCKCRAIKGGEEIPMGTPFFTIENTNPKFVWLIGWLETVISAEMWKPMTVATVIKKGYYETCMLYADKTCDNNLHVPFQCHDFSVRGQANMEDAVNNGLAHLQYFDGTDNVPAMKASGKKHIASIPACYDSETEVLTENGWKLFKNLNENEKVAQYHEGGLIDFVIPTKYYNMEYEGKMIHFDSKGLRYFDIMVTPNHKMFRVSKATKKLQMFEADDSRYFYKKGYGSSHTLIVSGKAKGSKGLSSIDRLKIAFQADGSYPSRVDFYTGEKTGCFPIRFSLKKERKKDKLIEICESGNIEYTVSKKDNRGYYSFWIKPTEKFSKTFDWVNLSKVGYEWAREFIEELQYWDGTVASNCIIYSSVVEENVDKIQGLCVLAECRGKKTSYKDKRENRKEIYTLSITRDKKEVGGQSCIKKEVDYKGTVHCVSVPTKMLLVRRNGEVAMCGNTEHSIMCSYEQKNELELFRHLMNNVYPSGLLSIVSDTWDYWNIFNKYLPILKEEIIARDGRVVIRPDSGNPVDIICGNPNAITEHEKKGSIELLWDIFGGTVNSKGYKVLNPHIGLIYGDGITPEILQETFTRLEAKGFASSNIVFGVGSYSLSSMYSRDSFGMAIKATHIVVNGEERLIYKNPKTSKGNIKKSLKGRAVVLNDEFGSLKTIDSLNMIQEKEFEEKNQLKVFYCK